MTIYEQWDLIINVLILIVTTVVARYVYKQTQRNTEKQIEIDKKIAQLQIDSDNKLDMLEEKRHNKDVKIALYEFRSKCYLDIYKYRQKLKDIRNNGELLGLSSFAENNEMLKIFEFDIDEIILSRISISNVYENIDKEEYSEFINYSNLIKNDINRIKSNFEINGTISSEINILIDKCDCLLLKMEEELEVFNKENNK